MAIAFDINGDYEQSNFQFGILNFIVKEVVFFDDFAIINEWQHFGNRKAASQNK